MYAVIKIGGNQHKVSLNQKIEVDKLPGKEGEILKFPALLIVNEEKTILGPEASKIMVSAKILKTYKGEKVDISRFHHKTRHRRHIGFRPMHTELEITAIGETKSAAVKVKTAEKKSKAAPKLKKTA